jgi:hypothetical protein
MHACWRFSFAAVFLAAMQAGTSVALTVPYTEDFTATSANWANFNSTAVLTNVATGGPDGGFYDSGTGVFNGKTAGSSVVVLRARPDFNASAGAFFGNWATAGAGKLSLYVRQNTPETLTYFARLAVPGNSPGAFQTATTPVPPNQWTKLSFDLSPTASFDTFEGSDWHSILSNVSFVSFGVDTPASLINDATPYKFDIDKVSLTPEPSTCVFLVIGGGVSLAVSKFGSRRKPEHRGGRR